MLGASHSIDGRANRLALLVKKHYAANTIMVSAVVLVCIALVRLPVQGKAAAVRWEPIELQASRASRESSASTRLRLPVHLPPLLLRPHGLLPHGWMRKARGVCCGSTL